MSVSRYEGWLLAGRYRLLAELGQGGMGRVWRAHDELLDRPVAVKEVTLDHRPQAEREELLGRTMREARLAARLTHPHIAAVHDVVVADERPWIILQLISAPTLAGVLDGQGPLPPAVVAEIGLQLLEALQVAHAAGIVHRDVKPANILLDAGHHAVLTDFGLATSLRQPTGLTQADTVVGTPAYIAPERVRGGPPTPETDLWSLGVTLYVAVEGRSPFDQGSPMAILSAVLATDPAPFERAGPLVPLITGLLAKDPGRRTGVDEARRHLHRISTPRPEESPDVGAGRPALALSAHRSTAGLTSAAPTGRRRLATYARHAAPIAALIISVLAATSWPDGRPGGPTTARKPDAGPPTTSATSPPGGILQVQPVTIRRNTTARQHEAPPAAGADTAPLPPGQAKKTGVKNGHAKHVRKAQSSGKGHK
jgi:serine/threonine protein kinase